jgi:hypothetical protein
VTDTKPQREKSPRILAALEGQFRPKRYHREATLRPATPLPANLVGFVTRSLPTWDWTADERPAEDIVRLDGNGAWIAAASSVQIGMEQLTRTGKMPMEQFLKDRAPGYYQVRVWNAIHPHNACAGPLVEPDPSLDLHSWSDRRFVSPLGRERDGFVWICEPTLKLLTELQADDEWWGALDIVDSWTAETKTDLRDWTSWVDAQRLELKSRADEGAEDARETFKLRYAQAVQMLGGATDEKTGRDKCLVKRPDWYHAIIAQHRANQWRKTWRAIKAEVPVVAVGGNDEIHVTRTGYDMLREMAKPPIRLHPTALGAYDVKGIDIHQGRG